MSANVRAVLLPYCQTRPGEALVFEHEGEAWRADLRDLALPALRQRRSGLWQSDDAAGNVVILCTASAS